MAKYSSVLIRRAKKLEFNNKFDDFCEKNNIDNDNRDKYSSSKIGSLNDEDAADFNSKYKKYESENELKSVPREKKITINSDGNNITEDKHKDKYDLLLDKHKKRIELKEDIEKLQKELDDKKARLKYIEEKFLSKYDNLLKEEDFFGYKINNKE
ncbi:MAG: hypothetical protein KH091_14000 [Parabacteroides merdae]|nr:hypothetical protein [Parabacteroides merdae]